MKLSIRLSLALAVAVVAASTAVHAHFKLLEPASWIVESERGDPQKIAPCGATLATAPAAGAAAAAPQAPAAPAVTPTAAIGKYQGGSKLRLKIQETIYHPGHYRVALSVNSREEIPPDPYTQERTTERGPQSVWATIQSPPQIPVIADGLFPHYTRPPQGTTMPLWEADVQLPNINCPKCTLQVLQFMANHGYNMPGGYSYHHCADLAITADPAKPIDAGWPVAK